MNSSSSRSHWSRLRGPIVHSGAISPEEQGARQAQRQEEQWEEIEVEFVALAQSLVAEKTRTAAVWELGQRFPHLSTETVEKFLDRSIGAGRRRKAPKIRTRDREIIEAWETEPLTLEQLGARFDLTRERVRQILKRHGAKSKAEVISEAKAALEVQFEAQRPVLVARLTELAVGNLLTRSQVAKTVSREYPEFPEEMIKELILSSRIPFSNAKSRASNRFSDSQLEIAVLLCFGLCYPRALQSGDYSRYVSGDHEAELKKFSTSESFPSNIDFSSLLNAIGYSSLKREQKVLDPFAHVDYERRRVELWSQNGWGSGSGGKNWPPTQQTIAKRLGGGYWNDAMKRLGFPISSKKGRPRTGYLHNRETILTSLGEFLIHCATDNGSNSTSVRAFETWRRQASSEGVDHASAATIRATFGSWSEALHAARLQTSGWTQVDQVSPLVEAQARSGGAIVDACIHGIPDSGCDECRNTPSGITPFVYITSGGHEFHVSPNCENAEEFLDDLARLGFSSQEVVQVAWKKVSETREPCPLCFPGASK